MAKTAKEHFYICILVFVYLFITLFYLGPAYQDDSFITFIYARNLGRGNGLVYNTGEYVEGFSSPLYTILLGLLYFITGVSVPFLAIIVSLIAGCFTIFLLFRILQKYLPDSGCNIFICLSVIIFFSPFLVESVQGMETTLYIFLLTCFIYSEISDKRHWINYLLYFSLILTRPEGVFLLTGYFVYKTFLDRKHIMEIGFITLFYLIVVGLRYVYYCDIWPNTFYAKTPFSMMLLWTGFNKNISFLKKMAFIAIPCIIYMIIYFKKIMRRDFILVYPILFYIFFISYIGGGFKFTARYDIFPISSYIVLYSLLAIKVASGLRLRYLKVLFLIILALANIFYNRTSFRRAEGFHSSRKVITARQREFGLYLKNNYPKNTLMSTGQAGAIKYYSDFANVDLLGLCDRHIARQDFDTRGLVLVGHLKGDGDYVLEREPDLIIFHNGLFSDEPCTSDNIRSRTLSEKKFSGWLSEVQIMENEEFWLKYEFQVTKLSDFYAHYYIRK